MRHVEDMAVATLVFADVIWDGVALLVMSKQCAPLGATPLVAHARVAFAPATLGGVVPIAQSAFARISAGGMAFV
jgi:hypothetical protein